MAFVRGRAIFRDPEVLRTCAHGIDTSVFHHNMKNVCVPSCRRYEAIIRDSLCSLENSWLDHCRELTERVLSPIVQACSTAYASMKHSTSRSVLVPHLTAQLRKLPPWLVVEAFDKGVEVPSFACIICGDKNRHKPSWGRTALRKSCG